MPTPVGHSLAGTAIELLGRGPNIRRQWPWLLLLIALANLPDIDFAFGYLAGDPTAYHWGPTHSLMATFLVGGAVGIVAGALSGEYASAIGLSFAAYGSHILL